ncbi:MAG TPA: hypothetical protein VLA92_02115, partial [Candidatus Saccharimonadales bacterium]|nr:hypothetical protein [Candidatus Saccharimonadales bacterium]
MIEVPTIGLSKPELDDLFTDVNQEFGISEKHEEATRGGTSYVAINPPGAEIEASVTRIVYAANQYTEVASLEEQLVVYEDLRCSGAQLPAYAPKVVGRPGPVGDDGGYVATNSQFLPIKGASFYHFGGAIASLHNASQHIDLSRLQRADPHKTITDVRGAIDFLMDSPPERRFAIGDAKVTAEHIATFENAYHKANELLGRLFEVAERNGSPLAVVLEDVHDENVRRTADGTAQLIDLFPLSVAPRALDFGRVLNDFSPHFGYDPQCADEYLAGYADTIVGGKLPNDEELELAADFTQLRSSLLLGAMAINHARYGVERNEWMLAQGLHRLEVIEDRHAGWGPLTDKQK